MGKVKSSCGGKVYQEGGIKMTPEETEQEVKDKNKFSAVIMALQVVKSTFWFTSQKYKKLYIEVCTLIDKIINHIKEKN